MSVGAVGVSQGPAAVGAACAAFGGGGAAVGVAAAVGAAEVVIEVEDPLVRVFEVRGEP